MAEQLETINGITGPSLSVSVDKISPKLLKQEVPSEETTEEQGADTQTETEETSGGEEGGNTEESATSGKVETEDVQQGDAVIKAPKGFRKRIDKLNGKLAEQTARAQVLEQELQRVNEELASVQAKTAPRLESFSDPEAYADARAEYLAEQKVAQRVMKDAQERAQAAHSERIKTIAEAYQEKETLAEARHADYRETLRNSELNSTVFPGHIITAILESDIGPEISYYLAKNPKEAKAILGMTPASAVKEIGKIEGKIAASPAKPTSKAPAPVTPLRGQGGSVRKNPADMSMEEYAEHRKAEKKAAGGTFRL